MRRRVRAVKRQGYLAIFKALDKPLFFRFVQIAFCYEFGKLDERFAEIVKPLNSSNIVVLHVSPS